MKAIKIFLILFFLGAITISEIYAQRIIKGRVVGEDLEDIMVAIILDNNDNRLAETDINGFFELTIPNEFNKIAFGSIGFEWANVEISDSCNYIEIILLPAVIYDFISSRKVDKLRKKRFDNLPQLHLTAVEKGLFTNETICYSRPFEPHKPIIDEIGKELKIRQEQIKIEYKNLSVGDTIKIPIGQYNARFSALSSFTDTKYFDCIIVGVVTKKYRNRYYSSRFPWVSLKRGYNFTYRITGFEKCKLDPVDYHSDKVMQIGQEFEHDMRIIKAITK